jgi:hypothetical protein
MSFIINLHLILLISVQKIDVTYHIFFLTLLIYYVKSINIDMNNCA